MGGKKLSISFEVHSGFNGLVIECLIGGTWTNSLRELPIIPFLNLYALVPAQGLMLVRQGMVQEYTHAYM